MSIRFPNGKRFRTLLILAFAFAASLGALLVFFGNNDDTKTAGKNRLLFPQEVNWSNADIDSDGDGLKDWEEEIYGTDIEKADTDGDGTDDKTEIAQSRDPLKSPPDEITAEDKTKNSTASVEFGKQTLTGKVAESFIQNYFGQRAVGTEFNPQDITKKVLNTMQNETPLFKTVKMADLKIVKTDDPQKTSIYLNSVATIAWETLLNWDQDPLQMLASLMQQENFGEQLYRFDPFIVKTGRALKELTALEVPEPWAREHLVLVNKILVLDTALKAMRSIDKDIVFALTTLQPFMLARDELRTLLGRAQKRIASDDIKFSKDEPMGKILALKLQ